MENNKVDGKAKKINLRDLYFGIMLYPMNTVSRNEKLEVRNLFNSVRVLRSVARYVTMTDKEKKALSSDPLVFCFGDTWGRCEYEFVVCPWGGLGEDDRVSKVGTKMDTFEMYVRPNAELLMDMVNSVSVSSAKKYLAEERARYRR